MNRRFFSLNKEQFYQKLLNKNRGKIYWISILLFGLLLIVPCGCNLWIIYRTQDRLYNDVNLLPNKKVALVLGTSRNLSNGHLNRYFKYRMEATVQLYQAGKIKHVIVSGSNHIRSYNEPREMWQALVARGIPSEAITLDYAGFRTLDSVVRCKKVFSQDDIIIVSQAFHNRRALFISDFYGLKAVGFNAEDVSFLEGIKTRVREYFARCKAVLDLYILRTQPKFLGEKVDIPI